VQFKPILPLAFILLLATSFSTARAGGAFDVTAFGAAGNGIHAEGPLPQSLVIRNNRLTMGTGNGMVIVTPLRDGSTITHNTISGSKSAAGIFVASPKSPNAGAHAIADNTITGFGTEVSIDRAKHPGTKLSPR